MPNQVRIIGGQFRGKKLSFPSLPDLRPTGDRVKETLFNWLMAEIKDASCLDLFAGSGSLGFEALSRGAKEVTMVEASLLAFSALQKNASVFNDKIKLIHADAFKFLATTEAKFSLIFLDPPFNSSYLDKALELIKNKDCLNTGGLIYLESFKEIKPTLNNWIVRKEKKAGEVYYALWEKVL